jgi:hypothetical protein
MSDLKVRPTKRAGRYGPESGVKAPHSKSGAAREGRYKGVERTGLKTRHYKSEERAGRSSPESGVKPLHSKSGVAGEGRYKGVERTGLKTRHYKSEGKDGEMNSPLRVRGNYSVKRRD